VYIAAMLGAGALQSAGAGLPNLIAVIAPLSLLSAGIGVIVAAAGRAIDVWRADRRWFLGAVFVLVSLCGASLAGYSGWLMFRLY
jgi:hypothetical protein